MRLIDADALKMNNISQTCPNCGALMDQEE